MKKIKHFWMWQRKECSCGNRDKVIFKGMWLCVNKINEELKDQDYKLIKKVIK